MSLFPFGSNQYKKYSENFRSSNPKMNFDFGSMIVFYMKRRIESDNNGLRWWDAPECMEDHPPAQWLTIEKAARIFEAGNRAAMRTEFIRVEERVLTNFRDLTQWLRGKFAEIDREHGKAIATIMVISVAGYFGRLLAEKDMSSENTAEVDFGRHYQREIHQLSLWSFVFLHGKWADGIDWNQMEDISHRIIAGSAVEIESGTAKKIFNLLTMVATFSSGFGLGFFVFSKIKHLF